MKHFLRSFWPSLLTVLIAEWISLFIAFRGTQAHLPARPSFPVTSTSYLCDYGYGGSAGHYLFRFGFLGVGEKIRQSEVVLLGSSHVQYGLCAGQLAQELTTAAGRPVRVYNLGLGFGENLPFDHEILAANGASGKAAVIDLYTERADAISSYGRMVDKLDKLGAFLQLANFWVHVTSDWLLDPWLPRLLPREAKDPPGAPIKLARMLGYAGMRRWDDGDSVEFWTPELGPIYTQPSLGTVPAATNIRITVDFNVTALSHQLIKNDQLRPVFTMIPWGGRFSDQAFPPVAPYVAISPDGLSYFDTFHLNVNSRQIATERFFNGLTSAGLMEGWLGTGAVGK